MTGCGGWLGVQVSALSAGIAVEVVRSQHIANGIDLVQHQL
jgi:hypothetical protein